MSKTILLNHSNWHFTKENPGIPTAVMGEAITLPHTWNAVVLYTVQSTIPSPSKWSDNRLTSLVW